jgi:hypothetical protein
MWFKMVIHLQWKQEFKPNTSTQQNAKTNTIQKTHQNLDTTVKGVGISNHFWWFEITQIEIISYAQKFTLELVRYKNPNN